MIDKEWQLNNMRLVDANELRKHAVTVYQGNGVELEPIEVVPLAEIDNAETYNQVGHKMATAEGFITNPEWKKGGLISRSEVVKILENVEIGKFNRVNVIETIKSISTVERPKMECKGCEYLKDCETCEDKAKQYSLGFQDGYLLGSFQLTELRRWLIAQGYSEGTIDDKINEFTRFVEKIRGEEE